MFVMTLPMKRGNNRYYLLKLFKDYVKQTNKNKNKEIMAIRIIENQSGKDSTLNILKQWLWGQLNNN